MKGLYIIAVIVSVLLTANLISLERETVARYGEFPTSSSTKKSLAGEDSANLPMAIALDMARSLPLAGLCHILALIFAVIRLCQKRRHSAVKWLLTIPSGMVVTLIVYWMFLS